jgi:hypothetical protein
MLTKDEWYVPMVLFFIGTLITIWTDHPIAGLCVVIYASAMRIAIALGQ